MAAKLAAKVVKTVKALSHPGWHTRGFVRMSIKSVVWDVTRNYSE
jgi:hypothetical protein